MFFFVFFSRDSFFFNTERENSTFIMIVALNNIMWVKKTKTKKQLNNTEGGTRVTFTSENVKSSWIILRFPAHRALVTSAEKLFQRRRKLLHFDESLIFSLH